MDTYEKKYKDALERAKEWYNDQHITIGLKGNLKDIFPELKESEDKQAKEWILEYLYDGLRKSDEQFKGQFKYAIACLKKHWLESKDAIELEKQDEKSLTVNIDSMVEAYEQRLLSESNVVKNSPFIKMCVIAFKRGIENTLDELHLKQGEQKPTNSYCEEHCKGFQETGKCFSDGECKAKSEAEQNSADKIEPKFKVGDWITDGEYTWKVTYIKRLDYILQSQNGDTVDDTISYVDEHFHLWTIEDAKDGDILANNAGAIFINAGIGNDKRRVTLDCYCYLSVQNEFCIERTKTGSWFYKNEIRPAIKEQCDLLFEKMKEAGYEWDADKKELKNVEQNTVWSEEDDAYIALISGILNYEHRHGQFTTNGIKFFNNNIIAVEQIQDWLESLKDKVQPKWKPTEEQMNAFYWMKQYPAGEFAKKDILNSLYNDLKKL